MTTEFNNDNLGQIRADIEAALKVAGAKHGMKLGLGKISYNKDTFTCKLTAAVGEAAATTDGSGSGELQWRTDYKKMNLPELSLGTKVNIRGEEYILVGARPKSHKQLVLKNIKTGKYIGASVHTVKMFLDI